MSAETEREGRGDIPYYFDLLASVMREVSAGVYQLVTTTGISDRIMDELREGRPNIPYFDDLWSKVMTYDSGTGKWYLNVSGGGGGGGDLQTVLDNGNTSINTGIVLQGTADLNVNGGNVYVNGVPSVIKNYNHLSNRQTVINDSLISIDKVDGSGSVDGSLMTLTENLLSWQNEDLTGSVYLQPYQYNGQNINLPDIDGGMKTVGTWDSTFVSGVITLVEGRFFLGLPNFSIMITNTNGSSSLAHAYKFELIPSTFTAKITALKQNGGTETNDVSSVRISCLF